MISPPSLLQITLKITLDIVVSRWSFFLGLWGWVWWSRNALQKIKFKIPLDIVVSISENKIISQCSTWLAIYKSSCSQPWNELDPNGEVIDACCALKTVWSSDWKIERNWSLPQLSLDHDHNHHKDQDDIDYKTNQKLTLHILAHMWSQELSETESTTILLKNIIYPFLTILHNFLNLSTAKHALLPKKIWPSPWCQRLLPGPVLKSFSVSLGIRLNINNQGLVVESILPETQIYGMMGWNAAPDLGTDNAGDLLKKALKEDSVVVAHGQVLRVVQLPAGNLGEEYCSGSYTFKKIKKKLGCAPFAASRSDRQNPWTEKSLNWETFVFFEVLNWFPNKFEKWII